MTPQDSTPRWVFAYLAIAAFIVSIIAGGLYFNHLAVKSFSVSVDNSVRWEKVFVSLERLRVMGGEVDLPGNNVFQSLDPKKELSALDLAVQKYQAQSSFVHQELLTLSNAKDSSLLKDLFSMGDLVLEMSSVTKEILSLVEAGKKDEAAVKMAKLDQTNALLSGQGNHLQEALRKEENASLNGQLMLVRSLQSYSYWLVGLFLLALVAAIFYGYQLPQHARMLLLRGGHLVSREDFELFKSYQTGEVVTVPAAPTPTTNKSGEFTVGA